MRKVVALILVFHFGPAVGASSYPNKLPVTPESTEITLDAYSAFSFNSQFWATSGSQGGKAIGYFGAKPQQTHKILIVMCRDLLNQADCQPKAQINAATMVFDAANFVRDNTSPKLWIATPSAVFSCSFLAGLNPIGCIKMADLPNSGDEKDIRITAAPFRSDRGNSSQAFVSQYSEDRNHGILFVCDDFDIRGCVEIQQFSAPIRTLSASEEQPSQNEAFLLVGYRPYRCFRSQYSGWQCEGLEIEGFEIPHPGPKLPPPDQTPGVPTPPQKLDVD